MSGLGAREAYRLWASTYAENAVTFLDEELAKAICPPSAGLRLLDAGCGTGRRLAASQAALGVGIDLTPEMLNEGEVSHAAAADVRALPFGAAEFDLVWCRLVLGYVEDLPAAYCELARVLRPAGFLFVSDFHSDAMAAGHKRTFRDAVGVVREAAHFVHVGEHHLGAAAQTGLVLADRRDGRVDESVRPFYQRADRMNLYERDRGLNVVAAFLFRRAG